MGMPQYDPDKWWQDNCLSDDDMHIGKIVADGQGIPYRVAGLSFIEANGTKRWKVYSLDGEDTFNDTADSFIASTRTGL